MKNSKTYAWVITLLAAFGGYMLLKRGKQSNLPSLVTNNDNSMKLYEQYDYRAHGDSIARGYRNNNPLNLDQSANAWKGKIKPSQDKRFETFVSQPYGYRAALITMRTYISKYGLNTIYEIINRWAPADDGNNLLSYTKNVCNVINSRFGMNVTPDTVVTRDNKDLLTKMAYAMTISENGDKEYARALGLPNMDIINLGWSLI